MTPISNHQEATDGDDVQGTLMFRDHEHGCLVERPTVSLRPHPHYQELWEQIASTRMSRIAQQAGRIVDPLATTIDGTILDGHARWQIAMQRKQSTLPCIVYEVSPEEAIEFVIRRHRAADGLNAYARILLALRLETHFRERTASPKATVNADDGSSKLTERKPRDVRQDIARVARVSTGNVTKVKQIVAGVIPAIQDRLLRGDVSIHRAWQWRALSAKGQRDALWTHLNRRGLKTTIRQLVSNHKKSSAAELPTEITPAILRDLANLDPANLAVAVVDVPGRAVVLTRDCYADLQRRTDAAH